MWWNKRDKEIEDKLRIYRGLIPWSVTEYDWIITTYDERRKNKNENLKLAQELAHIKEEMEHMRGRQLENFQSLALFGDIFHKKYPKNVEYEAHFYRFHQINKFMQAHHKDFVKLKFIAVQGGKRHIVPQLIETLCTIRYSQEEEDGSGELIGCSFSYPEVVEATQAKINAHLN